MIVGESKVTRCVMGRIERGEEVLQAMRDIARMERIDAGFVHAQGAVEAAELSAYDATARGYVWTGLVAGPAELVSLEGNVSLQSGSPEVRLWAVLAPRPYPAASREVAAGLLARARAVYVEFAIDVYDDGDLDRRPDAATGLALWRAPRRH